MNRAFEDQVVSCYFSFGAKFTSLCVVEMKFIFTAIIECTKQVIFDVLIDFVEHDCRLSYEP